MTDAINDTEVMIPPSENTGLAVPSVALPQPSQNSIDLTADSDGEDEPRSVAVLSPSQKAFSAAQANRQQVGLNGFQQGGPSVNFMNGNGNANGHHNGIGQAGPSGHQQQYPSYSNSNLTRTPSFGSPSFGSRQHPPNGNGMIHPRPYQDPSLFRSYSNGNGSHFQSPNNQSSTIYSPRMPPPSPAAGPSNDGFSSTSAIDLTSSTVPSPSEHNPKKPIFIGAVTTDVFMLYPSSAVFIGATDEKEHLDIVHHLGAEFLKVKLKVCLRN
jgi:hypothetical protein